MLKTRFTLAYLCLFFLVQLSAQQAKPKPKTAPAKPVQAAPKVKSLNLRVYESALQEVGVEPTLAENFTEMSKHFLGHDSYMIRPGNEAMADDNGRVKLQRIGREGLHVDLEIFDCQSFIEYTLALTQARRMASPSYEGFREKVKNLRYRNGSVTYAARLHYFTSWIYEHEKTGLLKDVSKDLGGEIFEKDVHYMSLKKDTFYGNMADPATFAAVRKIEKDLTAREKYFIPKDKLAALESGIKDGDIIAITNAQDGMDVAHTGVAYWQGAHVHLMHASSETGFVVVTNEPLFEYLATHRKHTGIIVARLN
jgi:Protein of unknown function (DUF1460)